VQDAKTLYIDKKTTPRDKRGDKWNIFVRLYEAFGRGEGLPNHIIARGGDSDGNCISGKRRCQELALELPALCGWDIRTQRIGNSHTFVSFLVPPEHKGADFAVFADDEHGITVYRFEAQKAPSLF